MAKIEKRKDIEANRTASETTVVSGDGADACEHGELHVKAVVAPEKHGFRRAGIYFPKGQEVTIPADTLSKERYSAIKNEGMLVVVEIEPKTE